MLPTMIEFSLNVIVHVFVLFIVLTILFWAVIRGMMENALKHEISKYADESFQNIKENLQPNQRDIAKNFATQNSTQLQLLSKLFSIPDPVTTTTNKWVMNVNIIIGISILIILLVVFFTYWINVGVYPPILWILWENFWTFLCIGMIEGLFFYYVAIKFIPVKPSVMTDAVIDTLKANLS